MNSRVIYFMSLLGVAVVAASSMIATAQEDNTIVNNAVLNNTTLMTPGLNISETNETVTNSTVSDMANIASTSSFAVGEVNEKQKEKAAEAPGIEALTLDMITGTKHPVRSTFVIDGYTRPVLNWTDQDQSLLNAAYLSCRVGQTPHGYTTYYN